MIEKKNDPDFFALDDRIPELAREGKLAGAGREAIALQHATRLPVIIVEDGNIIRWYPDGHKVILQPLERIASKIFLFIERLFNDLQSEKDL